VAVIALCCALQCKILKILPTKSAPTTYSFYRDPSQKLKGLEYDFDIVDKIFNGFFLLGWIKMTKHQRVNNTSSISVVTCFYNVQHGMPNVLL